MQRQNGREYGFSLTNGLWKSDADITDILIELKDANNVRTGWRYTTAGLDVELYDATGKLLGITDKTGYAQTLTYSDASTPITIAPSAGLLIRVTDSFGRQLNLTYDATQRIKTMLDPANGVYSYGYDSNNNLASVTYPDTKVRTYLYGETAYVSATPAAGVSYKNALTGIVDENGTRFATWTYDANGKASSSEHAGGAEHVGLTYNSNSTAVTDALGTTRTTNLTTVLGVVKSTGNAQPGGSGCSAASSAITYDANGNVASRTNFNGNRTNYVYDLTRNLETSRTEGLTTAGANTPQTRTITTVWHPTFRLPAKVTEPGLETSYTYDTRGNITNKTLKDTATALTRSWIYTYTYSTTVPGALLKKVDNGPRTDVSDLTTLDYYAPDAVCVGGHLGCRGQVSKITNALGHITQITRYNAHGQPEISTDPNGLVSTLTYDTRQRLTNLNVGGEITQFQYDAVGQLLKTISPDGSNLNYTYDAAHRLTQITDGLGNKIIYTLDSMGNRIHEETRDPGNALVQVRDRQVDALNRLFKDLGAANQTTQYAYDSQGNLTGYTDPLYHTTNHSYNSLGQLIQSIDPANGVTAKAYDARGNLTTLTNPKNNSTQYSYDGLNNLTKEISPDRGTLNYTYDAAGNLKTLTDARGVKHTYTYDALNRPTQRVHTTVAPIPATATIVWAYDLGINGKGRLTGMTDETGSTAYTYSQQGRPLSKAQTTTVSAVTRVHTVSYSYNSFGQLTGQTTPSNQLIGYSYDTQGRVNSITLNGQYLLSNLQYQPFGIPKSWTWGNGQVYQRYFDSDGRLTDYPVGTNYRYIAIDQANNIRGYYHWPNDVGRNRNFTYDELDRLTGFLDGDVTNKRYQYDANGNRTSISFLGQTPLPYTIAANSNRLLGQTSPSVKSFSYDAAGNTISDGSSSLTWNAAGRLKTVTAGTNVNSYLYNGNGERLIKTGAFLSSAPHRFVYDGAGHLIGEYDSNNALREETLWLGDTPVAVIQRDPATGLNQTYYVHSDHLNTPKVLLNSANVPVWRSDNSDAFGAGLPVQDPDADGKAVEYNLRFPGQYYDIETGLHYNYFRDYNPSTGRYVQSDPIGLQGGLNTYAYVGGNPVNLTDQFGLESTSDTGGIPIPIPSPGTTDENSPPSKDIGELVQGCYDTIDRMFSKQGEFWKNLDPYRGKTKTNGERGKKRRYFEWDHTHGDVEEYDSNGRHTGTLDPQSGQQTKPPVPGRKIDL